MSDLTLVYTQTLESLILYHEFHSQQSKYFQQQYRGQRIIVPGICLFCGITFMFIAFIGGSDSISSLFMGILALLICILPGLLMFALAPRSFHRSIRKYVENTYSEGKNVTIFGEQELILRQDEIIFRNNYCESKYIWDAIEKAVSTTDLILIYTSIVTAIVIQKQTVTSGSWQEVEDFLNEKLGSISS